ELAPAKLRRPVTTVLDVLAAIPSVVFGLWAFYNLLPGFQSVFKPAEPQSAAGYPRFTPLTENPR
ncbi:MAG TPA: hypothetical protein PK828_09750, partial [Limnochordia bacterium]|nr:hypothetical protein [Limnochordia bacterium]